MKFPLRAGALAAAAALVCASALAGCSSPPLATVSEVTGNSTLQSAAVPDSTPDRSTASGKDVTEPTHFDAEDLRWDADTETALTLADSGSAATGDDARNVAVSGGTVTISAAGTYRVSGALSDGQLVVDAPKGGIVRIILDGAQITSSSGPGLRIDQAQKVLLQLADGSTNSVRDAPEPPDTAEAAPDAAIYSLADLTIAGGGELQVQGNHRDGISSQRGLALRSGQVTVAAANDGIKGKDYVLVLGGNYTVTAARDGVASTGNKNARLGWLHQYAGQLTVSAGQDGLTAEHALSISGGTAVVCDSTEAVEASTLEISGGTLTAVASDDGLNATGNMERTGGLRISGGTVTVMAEAKGLDSNGDIAMTGGVQVSLGTVVPAGTAIHVTDASGALLATFAASKPTASLVYAAKEIEDGRNYTISTGGSAESGSGPGSGSLAGSIQVATVTAGRYGADGH